MIITVSDNQMNKSNLVMSIDHGEGKEHNKMDIFLTVCTSRDKVAGSNQFRRHLCCAQDEEHKEVLSRMSSWAPHGVLLLPTPPCKIPISSTFYTLCSVRFSLLFHRNSLSSFKTTSQSSSQGSSAVLGVGTDLPFKMSHMYVVLFCFGPAKYLDDNKKLILAILENQNLGKLAECAQYQAQLQKNLMYLAAIADAQPQAPTMPPQVSYELDNSVSSLTNRQMGVRPGGAANNGMHPVPNEATLGGGTSACPPPTSAPSDTSGGNKQVNQVNPSTGTDAQPSSAMGSEDAK
nr:GRF1-interacting factor 3-like [Ipomoea batatas]